MVNIMNILDKIVARKHEEVALAKRHISLADLQRKLENVPETRGFLKALQTQVNAQKPAVIAEVKKASPSKGIISPNFDPIMAAKRYEQSGASALSVLTDRDFFQGDDAYLEKIKQHVALPLLRKDFMVDEYQIYQSRYLGADCILLIVACLTDQQLSEYYALAGVLDMDALIEVHDEQEMHRALALSPRLLGVNNRNLKTFEVDIQTTLTLKQMAPADSLLVAESGLHTQQDIQIIMSHGVSSFLVGEAFMKTDDPGKALSELFGAV